MKISNVLGISIQKGVRKQENVCRGFALALSYFMRLLREHPKATPAHQGKNFGLYLCRNQQYGRWDGMQTGKVPGETTDSSGQARLGYALAKSQRYLDTTQLFEAMGGAWRDWKDPVS